MILKNRAIISREHVSLETKLIFPPEIFEHIADNLIEIRSPPASGNQSICCRKPPFVDVKGFLAASFALHHIGMARWVRVLTIRAPEDWEIVLEWPLLVRFALFFSVVVQHADRRVAHTRSHDFLTLQQGIDMFGWCLYLRDGSIRSKSVPAFAHSIYRRAQRRVP